MSRNFELLRRLGREPGSSAFQARILELANEPSATATAPTMASAPAHQPRVESALLPEIERLVQQVFILPGKNAPRVITFAGVESKSGDGVCARVADVLSVHSRSTCVVDANFDSPTIHSYFGMDNDAGLAESLTHTEPLHCNTVPGSSLSVLAAGLNTSESMPVLTDEALTTRLLELRERFQYVLIQAPPLGMFAHSMQIGQLSDGMILVLEAHSTRREAAKKIKDTLDRAKVKVVGTVLNNLSYPIPQVLYNKL